MTAAPRESETPDNVLQARIRFSSILVIIGLLVEAVSLKWAHPTAFLVFAFIGGSFMGVGIFIFLWSLASHER
jgi:hypothetical protein